MVRGVETRTRHSQTGCVGHSLIKYLKKDLGALYTRLPKESIKQAIFVQLGFDLKGSVYIVMYCDFNLKRMMTSAFFFLFYKEACS